MVRRHDARSHYGPVRYAVSEVDGSGRQDACRSDFVVDRCILRELEREYVLVIAYRDDCLKDENTRACDDSVAGTVVGVFPEDTVVNLVAAHYIW